MCFKTEVPNVQIKNILWDQSHTCKETGFKFQSQCLSFNYCHSFVKNDLRCPEVRILLMCHSVQKIKLELGWLCVWCPVTAALTRPVPPNLCCHSSWHFTILMSLRGGAHLNHVAFTWFSSVGDTLSLHCSSVSSEEESGRHLWRRFAHHCCCESGSGASWLVQAAVHSCCCCYSYRAEYCNQSSAKQQLSCVCVWNMYEWSDFMVVIRLRPSWTETSGSDGTWTSSSCPVVSLLPPEGSQCALVLCGETAPSCGRAVKHWRCWHVTVWQGLVLRRTGCLWPEASTLNQLCLPAESQTPALWPCASNICASNICSLHHRIRMSDLVLYFKVFCLWTLVLFSTDQTMQHHCFPAMTQQTVTSPSDDLLSASVLQNFVITWEEQPTNHLPNIPMFSASSPSAASLSNQTSDTVRVWVRSSC